MSHYTQLIRRGSAKSSRLNARVLNNVSCFITTVILKSSICNFHAPDRLACAYFTPIKNYTVCLASPAGSIYIFFQCLDDTIFFFHYPDVVSGHTKFIESQTHRKLRQCNTLALSVWVWKAAAGILCFDICDGGEFQWKNTTMMKSQKKFSTFHP